MPKDALTPQARNHFTQFDQVDWLVRVSDAALGIGRRAHQSKIGVWIFPLETEGHES